MARAAPTIACFLAAAVVGGCARGRPTPSLSGAAIRPGNVASSYEVTVAPDLDLDVVATFRGSLGSDLVVDEDAQPFVEGLSLFEKGAFRPVPDGERPHLRDACHAGCQLRYRFRLRAAAVGLADVDVALLAGDALFAPPATWLLHPEDAAANDRFRFHVALPAGTRFVTAVHPVRAAPDTYEAGARTFGESTFAAFGNLRTPAIPGSPVEVAVAPGVLLSDAAIVRWIGTDVSALTEYMGRFPEDRAVVFLAPGTSEATRGKTFGGGGASVLIRLGTRVTEAALADDWVATHELIHVASPSIAGRHSWFSEGLASYVEPIARAQAGLLSPERVWRDLLDGLPQGLPGPSDQGLEKDDSWGRVYWGGALYFLLADLGVRQQTGNARSLADAVRAIAATGANVETTWPIERVLMEADQGTGTRVLRDLYDRMGLAPGSVDLADLWSRLGVRASGEGVQFDEGAPLSAFRRAITVKRAAGEIQTALP